VLRDSGFRLVSALLVQRKRLQSFPSLLKKAGELNTLISAFCLRPCSPGKYCDIQKDMGKSAVASLGKFALGPSVGKLTLGCCCHSTSSLFLPLLPLALLWLTAALLTPPNPRTNGAFPSCEDFRDFLQNHLPKEVEELGRMGCGGHGVLGRG